MKLAKASTDTRQHQAPSRADGSTIRRASEDGAERQYGEVLSGLRSSDRADGDEVSDASGDEVSDASGDSADPEVCEPLAIVPTLVAERTLRGGLAISSSSTLGQMDPTFSSRNVIYEDKDGQLKLSATLHCDYHWVLNPDPGPGMKDIATGTEAFITADNYEAIADAIDPDKGQGKDKPAYFTADGDGYWSRAATEAHEVEHARDDWEDWAASTTAISIAKRAFEAEVVANYAIAADINKLLKEGGDGRHPGKIANLVMADSDRHYGLPKPYMTRPVEQKAHAIGAAMERPLTAAIRRHGKALAAKAALAKEKEEATKKAADAAPKGPDMGGSRDSARALAGLIV